MYDGIFLLQCVKSLLHAYYFSLIFFYSLINEDVYLKKKKEKKSCIRNDEKIILNWI